MKATEITQTVIVRYELDPDTDMQDEATKRRATAKSSLALAWKGFPARMEWIETRFMPMGFVEVEYRTVIGLGGEK